VALYAIGIFGLILAVIGVASSAATVLRARRQVA